MTYDHTDIDSLFFSLQSFHTSIHLSPRRSIFFCNLYVAPSYINERPSTDKKTRIFKILDLVLFGRRLDGKNYIVSRDVTSGWGVFFSSFFVKLHDDGFLVLFTSSIRS